MTRTTCELRCFRLSHPVWIFQLVRCKPMQAYSRCILFNVSIAVPAGMDLQCPTVPRCAINTTQRLCAGQAIDFVVIIQLHIVSPDNLVFADL